MKSNMTALIAVMATVLLAAGCRRNTRDEFLVQSYDVKFFKKGGSAMAGFHNINSSKKTVFTDRSLITANGVIDDGRYKTTPDFFSWDFEDTLQQVSFVLKKKDATIINTVTRAQMGTIDVIVDTVLYLKDTMRVSWVGTPLQTGEILGVGLYRVSDSTQLQSSSVSNEFVGQTCTFDYAETSTMHPGVYQVSIVRQRPVALQQADGPAGGNITVGLYNFKMIIIK